MATLSQLDAAAAAFWLLRAGGQPVWRSCPATHNPQLTPDSHIYKSHTQLVVEGDGGGCRNREASSRETAAPLPAAAASTLSTLFSIVDAVLWMWGVISNTLFCCYLVMISCSLSRCSPPCYESPCGQNVNQRIVRCVGERPRSYRDEMIL